MLVHSRSWIVEEDLIIFMLLRSLTVDVHTWRDIFLKRKEKFERVKKKKCPEASFPTNYRISTTFVSLIYALTSPPSGFT